MSSRYYLRPLSQLNRRSLPFVHSQIRKFSTRPRLRRANEKPKVPYVPPPNAPLGSAGESHPLKDAPRSYGMRVDEFTLKPLLRPIGMNIPPTEGQNTGVDTRTFAQKRQDYADYQKHLERRAKLVDEFARPYFRDWTNVRHYEGKAWIAPPRPFRQDLSLYFPNLYGRTLLKTDKNPRNTTPLLKGKVSIVSVFGSVWGENQANTFVAAKKNPELHEIVGQSQNKAQLVYVNLEENTLKLWMINLFKGSLRRRLGKDNWDKYFIVQRGITREIRDSVGLLNSKVGYTYVVDNECKIRWAGSGDAHEEERASLNISVRRLLREIEADTKTTPQAASKKAEAAA